jgi:GGDEF domain-containing protein
MVGSELRRAERYSIFVSLGVMDLSSTRMDSNNTGQDDLLSLLQVVRKNIRDVDYASYISGSKLGLLFPETPRQGAETVVKRVAGIVRQHLLETGTLRESTDIIPLEMASYPDAAGAKTITEILQEWS